MNAKRKKNDTFVLTGCLAAVMLTHLPAVANHLVADSWVFMMPHSFIETLGYFFKSVIPPEWSALWLRPVPMFFFWLDTTIWPGTEWGPHVINILFHLVNVWLIWNLMRFIRSRSKASDGGYYSVVPECAACLVYGLHPIATGSVTWVAARFDVMSVTFGLAGLLMWLRWEAGEKGRFLLWSIIFLFACILSKEQGIVFITVCGLFSILRLANVPAARKRSLKGVILIGVIILCILLYRLAIFHGLGGYLTARHGLSIHTPVYYLLAVLWPYSNVLPDWSFSLTFAVASGVTAALVIFIWNTPATPRRRIQWEYIIAALALFAGGLATTSPNAGLTLERVMGHAESRFALIAVVGFALLTGIVVHMIIRTRWMTRTVLILMLVWAVIAAWRTGVQIQAWKEAGSIADSIISQTLSLAPNPPPNSQLLYLEVPRNNDQFAYIFGIGLKEAIHLKYPHRNDLTIIRNPKREVLGFAKPERDFVFQYHSDTGVLEKLRAEKGERKP